MIMMSVVMASLVQGQDVELGAKVDNQKKNVLEITATHEAWRLLVRQDSSISVNFGVMVDTRASIPAEEKIVEYTLFLSELKKIAVPEGSSTEGSSKSLYEINIYSDEGDGSLTGIEKFYCKPNPLLNYFLLACDAKWRVEGRRFHEWKKNSIILMKPTIDKK